MSGFADILRIPIQEPTGAPPWGREMDRDRMTAAALLLTVLCASAQAEDAAGCKDHPLFNRLKGYDLIGCENREFDEFRFPAGPGREGQDPPFQLTAVEGRRSELTYAPIEGEMPASSLQVIRNFQTAAKAAGGTVEGEYAHERVDLSGFGGGNRATTVRLSKSGREAWAWLSATEDGPYTLTIVEREAMRQDIVANEMLDRINKEGSVALYINFDTGKAAIKSESLPIVEQIVQMLRATPALKLEVGGHTDNIGAPDANQKLSEARAQAVVDALTTRGIAAARLVARGYGDTRPVADNRSEGGRASNRRVELSKR